MLHEVCNKSQGPCTTFPSYKKKCLFIVKRIKRLFRRENERRRRRRADGSRTPRLSEACLPPSEGLTRCQTMSKMCSGMSCNSGKVLRGLCAGHIQGTPIQGSKLRLPGYLSGKGFHSGEDSALITTAAARVRTQFAGECWHSFLSTVRGGRKLPLSLI